MPNDGNRVKEIFLEAAEQPDEAARSACLDRACGEDAGLRERVEELLRSHDPAGSFLGNPAVKPMDLNGATQELGVDPKATSDGANGADDLAFLSPSSRPDSLGRLGHYEMLQVLGKGGFGIVFRAFDETLQRVVAVKVMAPQIATLSPARKRFLREARSSAQVRHENVVQVYEVGERPLPYLAMEFVPGETLQQKLDRSGPLEVPEVLRIGRQIAEGLAAAHACDLIHRDIKPANVLIEGGPQQRVKITDFGLARAADDASISQSGVIAGTPMYMAPEQALGYKLDQRADLFSLGSVLYQMVAGRPPFRAPSTLAVLKRVAEESPRPIPEIIPETPAWLCEIIAKLHAKNPDDRYQSAREVADVLADCEAQLKAHAKIKDFSRIPRGKPQRSGRWKWVAAAAVLLLPVIALTVTEFAGVTHLFRGQPAKVEPIRFEGGPSLLANNELPSEAGDWVPLFNGKDLTGWKTRLGKPGNWQVIDGVLVGSRDLEGLFSTRDDYQNFHLRAEVTISRGGLADIWFRAEIPPEPPSPIRKPTGYTAHIDLTGDVSFRNPQTGSWTTQGTPDIVKPEEWYTLEVVAAGNHLVTKVNGVKVVDFVEPLDAYKKGHIALQLRAPDSVVRFRKIEIKELPPSAPTSLPTFTNGIGMEFVIVPKGKSWLGGDKDRLGTQEVDIPADFYLGKYEVTQEEWEKVMGENPSFWSRTGEGKDALKGISDAELKRFPVENVSWDQCQLFVAKLNKMEKETGWAYRLPKLVEWEYACRGGPMSVKWDSGFDFYFAKPTNTLLFERANFGGGFNRPVKVGSYEPNRLGLFDMAGNVAEWCDDIRKEEGPKRYLRGGCFLDDARTCRAQLIGMRQASLKGNTVGLRVARVPSGAPSPEAKTSSPD
jgi:serine/threonine protein kinase/formylglycine-generating enzyme required for sulfatase activity